MLRTLAHGLASGHDEAHYRSGKSREAHVPSYTRVFLMQVLPHQRIMGQLFVMGASMITAAICQRVSLVGHWETLLPTDDTRQKTEGLLRRILKPGKAK